VPRIHLVCRNRKYLTEKSYPEFESGFWTLYEKEATGLIGGMLYLHDKKTEPSYFGGRIAGYRLAALDEPRPGKIVFTVVAEDTGKDVAWEGDTHPMAWMGGILS